MQHSAQCGSVIMHVGYSGTYFRDSTLSEDTPCPEPPWFSAYSIDHCTVLTTDLVEPLTRLSWINWIWIGVSLLGGSRMLTGMRFHCPDTKEEMEEESRHREAEWFKSGSKIVNFCTRWKTNNEWLKMCKWLSEGWGVVAAAKKWSHW